jgi:hypothetical protein
MSMGVKDNRQYYLVRYKKTSNKGSFQICIFREASTFYNVMQVFDIEKRDLVSSSLDALKSFLYSNPFIFPEGLLYYETNQGLGYDWVELNLEKTYPRLSREWVKNHGYKSHKGLGNFYTIADSPLEALYQTIKGRGRIEEPIQELEVTSKLFRVDYDKVQETYTTECYGTYFIEDGTKKDCSRIRPKDPNVIPLFIVANSYGEAVTKAEEILNKMS